MKKISVFFIILACMFSSPNFGALLAFSSSDLIVEAISSTPAGKALETACYPITKVSQLSKTLRKPRLLKRALFDLHLPDKTSLSLLVFCFSLLFLFVVFSRKPTQVHLRSPPQF